MISGEKGVFISWILKRENAKKMVLFFFNVLNEKLFNKPYEHSLKKYPEDIKQYYLKLCSIEQSFKYAFNDGPPILNSDLNTSPTSVQLASHLHSLSNKDINWRLNLRDPEDDASLHRFNWILYLLKKERLDEKEVELELPQVNTHMEILSPPGMEELTSQIQGMFQNLGSSGRKITKKLRIKDALKLITDEEAGKLINADDIKTQALKSAEQNGIVFVDEIDKIANRQELSGPEVSRQGVQRDLLPLVEGTSVTTKYGVVRTDHVLFIGSGAFHLSKPSDLIPELQGRLPIRVELSSLSVVDFKSILTSTDACLTRQYQALMETENLSLSFTEDGITRIAETAWRVNEKTENIGARRLYTVMEKLLEELSFDAANRSGEKVIVNADYVDDRLKDLSESEDLARYVL